MTGFQLEPDSLAEQIPALVAASAVIAVVPATELRGWAAEMAWAVARAAAAGGRRTALIDCFVESPTLHTVAGTANDEGLVDAFEYGASLNRIVQQQPQANLFFIPTGTFSTEAEPLMQNPRWKRLSAGFRHEEALLLLYVSAEHLGGLAAEPDGMIVLAPQGLATAATDVPAVMEAIGRGMPLLAVVAESGAPVRMPDEPPVFELVTDDVAPPPDVVVVSEAQVAGAAATAAVPEASGTAAQERRPSHPALFQMLEPEKKSRWWVWLLVIAAFALAGWLLRDKLPLDFLAGAAPAAPAAAADSAAGSDSLAAASAQPVRVDTLRWAVRLGAFGSLVRAFEMSDSLEAAAVNSMIAPLRPANRPAVYRLYAGPFADSQAASSQLAALRSARYPGAGEGVVESVPLSVALGGGLDSSAALAERARLRRAGVPAFVLVEADGTRRLWAGAYDAAVQAALLQDLLTPTGAGAPVPRVGAIR